MIATLRTAIAIVLASWASSAAAWQLWTMGELYSNADGRVQFLEMSTPANGQEFLTGTRLQRISQRGTYTFHFPHGTLEPTAGRSMLIASEGFAALGLVTPDFVVPDGFFDVEGGTIDFGVGTDTWNYPALPVDGRMSLARNGTTAINSPRNFRGETGSVDLIPGTPLANFQGLWWRSPAGSESGWGLNVAHQGNTLFATWFTYDHDGNGLWLVMPNGTKVGDSAYVGTLYRTRGPPYDAPTFDASLVTTTAVGSASLIFGDGDNGTFIHTVDGVTASQAITRQMIAVPVPRCIWGGTPGARRNYQDLWWHSPAGSESGWGVNLTHQGDTLFATWFTYDRDGRPMWLVMPNGVKTASAPDTYTGTLYRTRGPAHDASPWNPSAVSLAVVGSVTFAFADASAGTFSYTVNGVSGSKPIGRQDFSGHATHCRFPE